MERAAERLLALGPQAVLIKGGGLPGLRGHDLLRQAGGLRHALAIGAGQGPLCHWHPLLAAETDQSG